MDKILAEFGIQPVLLAAQVVNFLILLFLLKKFLYRPILNVLETRKERIAQSLKQAEEIEKRLTEISEEEQKRILKAASEGEKIIKEAQDSRLAIIDEAKKEAEVVARRISEEAETRGQLELEKMEQQIKEHLAELVVGGLKAVTGKVLTEKEKKEIVDKEVKNLSN